MAQFRIFYSLKPWIKSQGFGGNGVWYRNNGINIEGHNGLDIRAYRGQSVYAAHDGTVLYAGVDSLEGYGVILGTDEKYNYKGKEVYYKTIYWHLLPTFKVKFGEKVKAGDLLGYADSTGFSTGDHLHFGLKPINRDGLVWTNIEQDNGYYGAIDPEPYFNSMYAEDIPQVLSISRKLVEVLQRLISLIKYRKGLN